MIARKRGRRSHFQASYFDHFWGCPICHRSLSIAEVIELHCESCNAAVEPADMANAEPIAGSPDWERLP